MYVQYITLRVCLDTVAYYWKLKIYGWKYCNKIIFKCVNSVMGPSFKAKFAFFRTCGSREHCNIFCCSIFSNKFLIYSKISGIQTDSSFCGSKTPEPCYNGVFVILLNLVGPTLMSSPIYGRVKSYFGDTFLLFLQ